MLETSRRRILESLSDQDVVLDIGGWASPFERADWVMDLMPYDTRGLYRKGGPGHERFRRETWIQRDICDREPYPFGDGAIDFVVCSHTLEDVRDPVWVCSEMARVARAGYIEVPSRLEEQSFGVHGPWVGWDHHRWLVDVSGDRIEFAFKHAVLHARRANHFPQGFRGALPEERRVSTLWWEGDFRFGERVFHDPEDLAAYLGGFVAKHGGRPRPGRRPRLRRAARRVAGGLRRR